MPFLCMCFYFPEQAILLIQPTRTVAGRDYFSDDIWIKFYSHRNFSSSITKTKWCGMLTFSLISISLGIMSVSYGDVMPIDNTNLLNTCFIPSEVP